MKSRKDYYSKPEYKEKHLEASKRYYEKHKEKVKTQLHEYYLENKEEIYKKTKAYKQTDSGKISSLKSRRKHQLKKYDLSPEQYNEMLTAQLSGCSICDKTIMEMGKLLVVDHNHNTGKVRKLLCNSCNTAIGLFYENPDLLRKAIDYLHQFN